MEKLESKTIVVKVKDLVPYARNPRRNDQAVETLKKSLMDFGYVSRIVVAEDMTIVAGHARLKAMMELGWDDKEIEVVQYLAPADKVRAYRLIDNKASELASWDWDTLDSELDDIETDMSEFFPSGEEFDPNSFFTEAPKPTGGAHETERPKTTCPYCGREFEL